MTTIYFVRHGTAENPNNICYGRMPGFHLSRVGLDKAKKLADYFVDKKIWIIFTSPLERTFETANAIAEKLPNVSVIHEYDLIEVNSNAWQGLPYEDMFKNESYATLVGDSRADIPNGENLNQVATRMKKVAEGICQKFPDKSVICVSHEFPIIALELKLKNHPLEEIKALNMATGSITKMILNEHCELQEVDHIELKTDLAAD